MRLSGVARTAFLLTVTAVCFVTEAVSRNRIKVRSYRTTYKVDTWDDGRDEQYRVTFRKFGLKSVYTFDTEGHVKTLTARDTMYTFDMDAAPSRKLLTADDGGTEEVDLDIGSIIGCTTCGVTWITLCDVGLPEVCFLDNKNPVEFDDDSEDSVRRFCSSVGAACRASASEVCDGQCVEGTAPEPTQAPTPDPAEPSTSEPTPAAAPEPTPAPNPEPTPAPTPKPTQVTSPEHTQAPTSDPTKPPIPEMTPSRTPVPTTTPTFEEPTAAPTPGPTPALTPELTQAPTSESTPAPTRDATESPTSVPTPVYIPEQTLFPTTERAPAPTTGPTPSQTLEPAPAATPDSTPAPTPEPTPARTSESTSTPTIEPTPAQTTGGLDVGACDPNPCQNGGTCAIDPAGGHVCSCASSYGGMACQTDTSSLGPFYIEVDFIGTWTDVRKAVFQSAADRWSEVITHVPCGGNALKPAGRLLISSTLEAIDRVGGTLGSAGPRNVWKSCNSISAQGTMRFDIEDIANLEADGTFEGVILHEMGHVIGVGTLWGKGFAGCTTCRETGDPAWTCPAAVSAYTDMGGSDADIVELDGAPGTSCAHLDEDIFADELMTGFVDNVMFLSKMTAAILDDIGYIVDSSKVDAYTLPSESGASIINESTTSKMKDTAVDAMILILDDEDNVVEERVGVMIEFYAAS